MKLSTLKSIRNIVNRFATRSPLAILNCFWITKEFLYFTDARLHVKVRHSFPFKDGTESITVRSDHFLQVMENITPPFFINCPAGHNIIFEQPESSRTLRNENMDGTTEYPAIMESTGMEPIFNITAHELAYMNIASQFVSDDDLRPLMGAVCVGKNYIVASDAHMLYHRKIGISEDVEVLFDRRAIKLMMLFSNQTFQIGRNSKNIFAISEDITIFWRMIEETANNTLKGYPNWKTVIPKVTHSIILPVKETIAALKSVKFALNAATHQVAFELKENKLKITAKDLDIELIASESVNVINSDNNTLSFGMKHDFVMRILKCFQDEGYSQISLGYIDPTRAFLFGEQLLCMPMLLN